MTYNATAAAPHVDAARQSIAAAPPSTGITSQIVPIYSTSSIRELIEAASGGLAPLFIIIDKYAPMGADGWVYTVTHIDDETVILEPLGGGRSQRIHPDVLALARPIEVIEYDEARRALGDPLTDTPRLESAAQEALADFWTAIATRYPEIGSGDLDPGTVMQIERTMTAAVHAWIEGNMPDTDD